MNAAQRSSLRTPWASPSEAVLDALGVRPEAGLSASEVARRAAHFGANRLRAIEARSVWEIALDQFKSLIVGLLVAAAIGAALFGELVEAVAVVAVIVINAVIGFTTELRAVRSMEALRRLATVQTTVRRGGRARTVPAEALVPGDIVLLEGGDVATADLRLVSASKLQADESTLTGESVPVDKHCDTLGPDCPLAERPNMIFKGSSATRGSAEGVVVATGMATELGRISALVERAEPQATPLERRLDRLGHRLVWVTLGIAVFVAASGIVAGRDPWLVVEIAIALAVATVPEGLPIVATVALARGMWRMAERNALVDQLSAVETLGSTSVVLTDKTGTLTENRMTLVRIALADDRDVEVSGVGHAIAGEFREGDSRVDVDRDPALRELLESAVLCNDAVLQDGSGTTEPTTLGDPTEIALLVAGAKAGLLRKALTARLPERREIAFDPAEKRMATIHQADGGFRFAVKGAPEAVLECCDRVRGVDGALPLDDAGRKAWLERNEQMAGRGLRVLAIAGKPGTGLDDDPYRELVLLGLVALLDPPRESVRPALEACTCAGVRVVMLTGDQPATALAVARRIGLAREDAPLESVVDARRLGPIEALPTEMRERVLGANVIARATPEQKLGLIEAHQARGAIVAMTGDGVNDAPALRKADIGVAMGMRGTQVAKEAAAMVLADDDFATIVAAIAEGRNIFANIRKFVLYLLSCNVSEILVVALASMSGAPLPLAPLQILFLNLVTDVFPALALGVGEGDPRRMQQPPRGFDESVLTRRHWQAIAAYGAILTASVLGAFAAAFALGLTGDRAVTVAFLSLALGQLWHVWNMRAPGSSPWRNEIVSNRWMWGAVALCVGLTVAAVHLPWLGRVLGLEDPGPVGWALAVGASSVIAWTGPWVGRFLRAPAAASAAA